jgi:hypothetical protein
MLGQLRGCSGKLDRVVKAAAMHGPQLAADALALEVFVLWRSQAAVEEHKVER